MLECLKGVIKHYKKVEEVLSEGTEIKDFGF